MTMKALPGVPEGRPCTGINSQILPRAMDRWNAGIQAADAKEDDRTISVYDVIGHDYWTGEGVTAKRVAAALRNMGAGPVTVNVNSPGGDMFEGLAIYNLLREHKGEVTVKVIGLAASAASVIAMAGDKVQIGKSAFFMIHNAWVVAMGNRNDLREYADMLEPFDRAMADVYAARTGQDAKAMAKLMDKETWINGSDAVEEGFADEFLASDQIEKRDGKSNARADRRVESALRASGMPKSEAMRLISELKSSAGDPAGGGEGDPTGHGSDAVHQESAVLAALKSFTA